MEQTIIKGRRRGEVAPFSQLKTTGIITSLPLVTHSVLQKRSFNTGDMCPYSRFIPLHYITKGLNFEYNIPVAKNMSSDFFTWFYPDTPQTPENWEIIKEKVNNHPYRNLIWTALNVSYNETISTENTYKGINKWLDDYLKMDAPLDIYYSEFTGHRCTRKDEVGHVFEGHQKYKMHPFTFRTYSGMASAYSIWTFDRSYNSVPTIFAVIPVENLVYQRLHMLVHGRPDINKMVVLVDNRVDGDFPHPAFKGFYRESLLPALKSLPCPVLKVPLEYIMENCFVQPEFHLKERNIIKRKKAVEGIIEGFYNKHSDVPLKVETIPTHMVDVWREAVLAEVHIPAVRSGDAYRDSHGGNWVAGIDPYVETTDNIVLSRVPETLSF